MKSERADAQDEVYLGAGGYGADPILEREQRANGRGLLHDHGPRRDPKRRHGPPHLRVGRGVRHADSQPITGLVQVGEDRAGDRERVRGGLVEPGLEPGVLEVGVQHPEPRGVDPTRREEGRERPLGGPPVTGVGEIDGGCTLAIDEEAAESAHAARKRDRILGRRLLGGRLERRID